jgi:hypothetical protein
VVLVVEYGVGWLVCVGGVLVVCLLVVELCVVCWAMHCLLAGRFFSLTYSQARMQLVPWLSLSKSIALSENLLTSVGRSAVGCRPLRTLRD